jgi:hypothetical protein
MQMNGNCRERREERNRLALAAESLGNRFAFERNRYAHISQLLLNRCAIAAQSLRNRGGIALPSLRNHFAIAAHLL